MRKEIKQRIFNTVVKHMQTQKVAAYKTNGHMRSCQYRTESNLKCAIGCLIPESINIPPDENGRSVHDLPKNGVIYNYLTKLTRTKFLLPDDMRFLSALQSIHDDGFGNYKNNQFTNWQAFADLAKKYGLVYKY